MPKTANEAYTERVASVLRHLDRIRHAVDTHADRQSAEPQNWGYVGELTHVEWQLSDIFEEHSS